MNFKKLKEEELQTMYPNNRNQNINDEYLSLYILYRKLFSQYVIEKIGLKEYDDEFEKSGLNFCINKESDMDIYQYFSSDVLKYFYIRNNVYIERLTAEEIAKLKEKITSNNYELDDETKDLIETTYQKVIFEDVLKNGEECITAYGPNSNSFFARNNSLVIGVRYDEFNSNGLDDNAWDKLHDEQLMYLYNMTAKMQYEIGKKVGVPVSVLKYNEYSVIKKDQFIKKTKNIDNEEVDI